MSLALRNVRMWSGDATDIVMAEGRIARIGEGGSADDVFEAHGATILPGLHDHHLHIFAAAARARSVDLAGLAGEEEIAAAISSAAGPAVRAVGYDERAAGLPDRAALDRWSPHRPLRVADRTGALWILNGAALAQLPEALPPGAERDAQGVPTGRFWREDRWLGGVGGRATPDVVDFCGCLAALGITGLTDAGARNGPEDATALAAMVPQRLMVMGDESLTTGHGYALGPLKLLIDERDPPPPELLAQRIEIARRQDRRVAAHCVTATELALFLAALDAAGGARGGDRIEHGGAIPDAAVATIAARGLTVVTNPTFVHDRGDRYRATIPKDEWPDLYRAETLAGKGIALAAGSDAPYASPDPWLGMRTARDRLTAGGHHLGAAERLPALAALRLYLGSAETPAVPRRIAVGAPADLVLCEGDADDILADLSANRVVATIVAGRIAFSRA